MEQHIQKVLRIHIIRDPTQPPENLKPPFPQILQISRPLRLQNIHPDPQLRFPSRQDHLHRWPHRRPEIPRQSHRNQRVIGGIAAVLRLRQQLPRPFRVIFIPRQAGIIPRKPRRQNPFRRHHRTLQQNPGDGFPVDGVIQRQPHINIIKRRLIGIHPDIRNIELRRPLPELAMQRIRRIPQRFQQSDAHRAEMNLIVFIHQQPIAPRQIKLHRLQHRRPQMIPLEPLQPHKHPRIIFRQPERPRAVRRSHPIPP